MAFLHQGEFNQLLFSPTSHEVRERFLVALFLLGFAFHADFLIGRREKAYEALSASEDKYRHLVELSPDAIAIQCNDQIVFINSAGVKLFGASKVGDLVGKSVWDFVLPENVDLVRQRYRQMREKGVGAAPVEQRFRRIDGTLVDVEVSAVPFLHEGKPAIQAIFRDITTQKKNRSELVKLRKAVESSGEVIFLTDREGIFTYVNPEFTRLYGFSEEDVVGKTTPRILKSDMLTARDYEEFWETILNKQVKKGTLINKSRDGTFVHVEVSANPVLDDSGEIAGFLAIQRDITDRIREEHRIQQHNRELRTLYTIAAAVNQEDGLDEILRESLDAILALDWIGAGASGTLFLLDEARQGLRLSAFRGVPANHPCLQNPPQLGECLCGLAIQQDDVVICSDGWQDTRHSRRWPGMDNHRDICLPIKARGKLLGVLDLRLAPSQAVSEADIGLLRSVANQIGVAVENAQLYELNQKILFTERERIARDLHDDMGQLLGYVHTKAMAARLHLKNWQFDGAQRNLTQLEEAAQRLSVDVRKAILDLRLSSSEKFSGNLVATLENYIVQFNMLSDLNVRLDVVSPAEGFILRPEAAMQMLRIVQEALTNAMKHAKTTEVYVALKRQPDVVELSITDRGAGFDVQSLGQSLYPRFGMNSMRERVEALEGTLKVDTKPGQGTTVTVSIPVQ
ncbi:MAG: PAS domain S-box protein [Chloroflexota bacterium]